MIDPKSFQWYLRKQRSTPGPWTKIAERFDPPSDLSEWSDLESYFMANGATAADRDLLQELHRRWAYDQTN